MRCRCGRVALTRHIAGFTMLVYPPAQGDAARGTSMYGVAPASPLKPTTGLRATGFAAPMTLLFCSGCRVLLAAEPPSPLLESGQSGSWRP